MAYEGYIDHASPTDISGWIFDNFAPNKPLDVEILDGDAVIWRVVAGDLRVDLQAAGKGNGRHAFSFKTKTPATGPLSARLVGKRWRIAPGGGHKLQQLLPMRFEAELVHSLEYGMPAAVSQDGFSTTPTASANDLQIANRLMRAYEKAVEDDPASEKRKRDQWTEVENAQHQEILSLLKTGNASGLMRYLRDAHGKGITHGITQGEYTTRVLRANPDARRLVSLTAIDYLTSLGEFLGLLDVECPDQHGQWGENIHSDPGPLIERISAKIGVPVILPQVVGSAFGIRTRHGILGTRDIMSLYASLRIKSVLPSPVGGSVCEIGGGLGGAAYYANRVGVAQYTIIDLPLVSLLQGYFLLSTLPGVPIALYGEEAANAAIQLLPTYAFSSAAGPFDLLFNQDSMPEIHRDYSIGYLREAGKKNIPLYLSINQEARAMQNPVDRQTAVRELVEEAGGYRPQYRFRHWIRAGYVEELFSLSR